MKKGISLIVLVITIIVLAILAGAIIISFSNTNIVEEASAAVTKADKANAKAALSLVYAGAVAKADDGKAYSSYTDATTNTPMSVDLYKAALTAQGFSDEIVDAVVLDIDANYAPVVATN